MMLHLLPVAIVTCTPAPPMEIAPIFPYELVVERLEKWNPLIAKEDLLLIEFHPVSWSNGALGCPLEGKVYTQARVEGFSFLFQYGEDFIELHTDREFRRFAIPEIGFI